MGMSVLVPMVVPIVVVPMVVPIVVVPMVVPMVVPNVVPMVVVPAPPHRNFRSPLCPDQSRLGTPDSTSKRFGLFRNPRPSRHHHQEVRLLIPSWRDLKLAADISVVTVFPASSVLNLTSHTP